MEFRIGHIVAKCRCGSTQFRIPEDEHSGPYMNYLCSSCGSPSQYSKLVTQIGREVLRLRRERLAGDRRESTIS